MSDQIVVDVKLANALDNTVVANSVSMFEQLRLNKSVQVEIHTIYKPVKPTDTNSIFVWYSIYGTAKRLFLELSHMSRYTDFVPNSEVLSLNTTDIPVADIYTLQE